MTGPMLASFATNVAAPSDVLLPVLIAVPLIGALAVSLIRDASLTRTIAVGFSVATLVLSVLLLLKLPGVTTSADAAGLRTWHLGINAGATLASGMHFTFAGDAISAWLVALTAVLTPCAILATRPNLERPASFFAWLLVLESTIVGAFLSSDLLLFYIFFELTLVPSFLLIGQWGGADKRAAAAKFFLYTFTGSLFMLASILYLALHAGSFDMSACAAYAQANFSTLERTWVLLGLLAGLAVKVPLLPVHTWLPITYTQSSAPVTAIVAGALGKLGTYGLLRIAIPMGVLPHLHSKILGAMIALSVLAIIYAALIAWVQRDYKTLVAYSSISHLGFCVLALCCLNTMGGQAGVLYMVNHGISTGAIFLMLGFIEQRAGTRVIENISGLGRERPKLAFFFVLFVMSSIGLPLTNGFVSEFLAILSTIAAHDRIPMLVTVMAASGVVLGAVYMLHLTAKLIFGPARQPVETVGPMADLNSREVFAILPLAVLVIALGVQPNLVLNSIKAPVATLMAGGANSTAAQTNLTEEFAAFQDVSP